MVLLVISLLGNVMLGVSFVRLSQQLGQTPPATAQQQGPHGPEVGTVLPAMNVRTLQGSRMEIAYGADAKPTLIYVSARPVTGASATSPTSNNSLPRSATPTGSWGSRWTPRSTST